MPTDETFVQYSVREILDDIRAKLDTLIGSMATKVDRSELQAVQDRQDVVIGRLDAIDLEMKHQRDTVVERLAERRYRMPVQLTVVGIIITVLLLGLGVADLVTHLP